MRRPTIIEVAREAGVSKSTVSLVIQESPLVKAETRVEVRRAMSNLGYVYNRAAANLRSAGTGLVGLVINDLRNPFFTEFATSVQMALSARGYATVVANTAESPALQAQVVASMIEHGISALVISPTYGDENDTFGPLERTGIPAMQVLRKVADTRVFPFASLDYFKGGRLATEHLVAQRERDIAFVGGPEGRPITGERMSGYLAVIEQQGLVPRTHPGRSSRAFGREAALLLSRQAPECRAALCFNDLVALGMMSGFAEAGRVVGRDFRLVGFDDIEECAQVFPQLSSVRCDIAGFGQRIAATMLSWLEDGERPPPERRDDVELVARASSVGEPV